MTNDLRLHSGSDVRFFANAGSSLTAAIDNDTGSASFNGALNIGGSATINGMLVVGQDLVLQPQKRIYFDGGVNTFLLESTDGRFQFSANANPVLEINPDSIAIQARQKLFLDGGGNSYLVESVDDALSLFAGGENVLTVKDLSVNEIALAGDVVFDDATCAGTGCKVDGIDVSELQDQVNQLDTGAFVNESGDQMQGNLRMALGTEVLWYSDNDITLHASVNGNTGNAYFGGTVTLGGNLILQPQNRIYFDGGVNTFLLESTDGRFQFSANGSPVLEVNPDSIAIQTGQKFYLDGGVDTYLIVPAANPDKIQFIAGGVPMLELGAFDGGTGRNMALQAGQRFFLDGGVGTYLQVPTANPDKLQFIAGGVPMLEMGAFGGGTGRNMALQPQQRLFLDGGADTYMYESQNDVMSFAVGSDPQVMQLTPTGVTITSGNELTMSGGNIAMAPLKTVDGVDVSELKNTVDTFINTSPSSSQAAFAYGRATFNNGNQSYPTLCAGFNINDNIANECRFLIPASNSAYLVMFTPVSDALNPCTSLRLFMASPLQSGFNLFNACVGSGSRPTVVNFVVYAQ